MLSFTPAAYLGLGLSIRGDSAPLRDIEWHQETFPVLTAGVEATGWCLVVGNNGTCPIIPRTAPHGKERSALFVHLVTLWSPSVSALFSPFLTSFGLQTVTEHSISLPKTSQEKAS